MNNLITYVPTFSIFPNIYLVKNIFSNDSKYSILVKLFGFAYISKLAFYFCFNYRKYLNFYIKKIPYVQDKIKLEQNKVVLSIKN